MDDSGAVAPTNVTRISESFSGDSLLGWIHLSAFCVMLHPLVACLLSIILIFRAALASNQCAEGSWSQSSENEPFLKVRAARKSLAGKKQKQGDSTWLRSACSVQTIMHSCYAHGDFQRAQELEFRHWKAKNSQCQRYTSGRFLEVLRGRKILLYGDSVMMQFWQTLVCAAEEDSSIQSNMRVSVDWFKHNSSSQLYYNEITCPLGAEHCHLHGGDAYFSSLNVTISFRLFGYYEKVVENRVVLHNTYVPGLLDKLTLRNGLGARDVVVLNWGLHAHTEHDYVRRLQALRSDAAYIKFGKLLFLETFPQHFLHGYFDFVERSDEIDKRCHSQGSNTTNDWKNKAANLVLGGAVEILRVAKELKSQHDAHLGANSKLIKMHVADCTHWCFPNGVFSYAATVLLNALLTQQEN